ncbi:MAG: hypothetical protein U5J83_18750 [Bryobacterales bacterium]|nr:hypothetical protein [Bryobacterales bacterium]
MVEEDRLRVVAANCGQAKPLTLLGETFDAGASPPANPPAAVVKPATPAAPAPLSTPENGLQILGLNRMTPGQHDRFTAADGFEQPYNGPVEWNSSVEDVVVIDRRTGDAVAFKPGKTVIIARRGDSSAYFNVTVDAVVSNLQGFALAQAQSLAAQDGLQVQRGASAGAPPTSEQAGRIARQDRAPGSRAPAGTVIRVDVYDGAVAAQNPAAALIDEPGGFESLGGETREVQPPQPVENADGRVPGNGSEIVDDFFRGETAPSGETVQEPARPQEDPFAQERAEEAARAERERQQRENAMMNLLGVMAGASQQMNDIRNRRSGQARPAVPTPPVQSTWPNAGSPPVYNPPGGNPSSSPTGEQLGARASNDSPSAEPTNACRDFPRHWRPRRSWTKQNGRMVETTGLGRYSVLGNWQNTSCDLNTSWEAIQEFECVKTGELRCQGKARK